MASRELMARFKSAFSNWLASVRAGHSTGSSRVLSETLSPRVRRSSSTIEVTRALMSVGFTSSDWRRPKASRRAVSAAARWAEFMVAVMYLSVSA
jgi:hypothetical protein